MSNPTAFISYSWDSNEQKEWTVKLVNLLRKNGIDATLDVFETQKGTINLNAMMVDRIRNSDYTIIILTSKYAEKADSMQGGVGFETNMLLTFIQENLEKIIPVMTKWNPKKIMPFYLKGVHYIDFSEEKVFNEKFDELIHRVFQVDLIEKEPLGEKPQLSSKKIEELKKMSVDDDLVPNFREITDIDKNRFMQKSFIEIKSGILELLELTKQKNVNFDFAFEDITSRKSICRVYINGNQKNALKIWLGNTFGFRQDSINLSYGLQISDSDNSMNEYITCEVDKNKRLNLKMNMIMFGNREANTPELIVKEIWKNLINSI